VVTHGQSLDLTDASSSVKLGCAGTSVPGIKALRRQRRTIVPAKAHVALRGNKRP
jgi:hypothetical protein